MLDEMNQKLLINMIENDQQRKQKQDTAWSKASWKHKSLQNPMQKENLLSHRLQDYAYE